MSEPIRLQKYFSDCGVLSRRMAESEILNGCVRVNGMPATLGTKITPGVDRIEYNGRVILPRADKPYRYVMLNKPRGIVCTTSDEKGRTNVTSLVHIPDVLLYPVGRLDMDSEGLLLLTDDGALTNLLTHPRHKIPKIYQVNFSLPPTKEQIGALKCPMVLDGYPLLPVGIRILNDTELEFTLYEGRNRQIRRMCDSVGLRITRLRRIAIGDLCLGDLPAGKWRELTDREVDYLHGSGTTGQKGQNNNA